VRDQTTVCEITVSVRIYVCPQFPLLQRIEVLLYTGCTKLNMDNPTGSVVSRDTKLLADMSMPANARVCIRQLDGEENLRSNI